MAKVEPLSPDALFRHTDPELLKFNTTDDVDDLIEAIGQPRAVEAVRFGIGINQNGYNIYALGPNGVGKLSLIKEFFEKRASTEPVPSDWVYVYNFKVKHQPCAIQLPPGKGKEFQRDMEKLVDELRTALSSAFESDEYRSRRQVIEQEYSSRQEKALEGLQEKAKAMNFSLLRTPGGLVFAPMRNGQVITPEEFQALPDEERKQVESQLEQLQVELQNILQQVPGMQREIREKMKELNRSVINFAVGDLINELKTKYQDQPKITGYLDEVKEDVLENADDFLPHEEEQSGGQNPFAAFLARANASQPSPLNRYKVNLLIDHSQSKGAPVIYQDNPTYQNLIGDVEHTAQMGALVTDFTLIKAGSLHQANGGYLILDVRKVLQQPYAWEGLKRALESCVIRIESLGQMLSVISTVTLEPEPIPLDVKVALVGDRTLYYMLGQLDPDFNDLFKVQADFDEQMDRDDASQQLYARLIASMAHKNKLKPLDRGAVARVIEYSSRMVEDSHRLSMNVENIADLLREADYWAGENDHGEVVRAADVQKAIDTRIYRADRLRQREEETILRNIWFIDTQGAKIGQVNGLSVITLGNFSFGRPSRITARIWLGKGEVMDIEREVDLSGPIHSKGVLILSSFLSSRYAQEKPLTLSASIVFEQSYGGIEGDSASSAELYVLLSAISEIPIKQNFAVTGSVNQHGQVQPIGGVNEKIEGFFDICKARGLTGDQGVLIPASNVVHLMLRQDVIDAVKAGQFTIYPVETIDEGIELLTGVPAGEPDNEGNYPPDSINGIVMMKLARMVEQAGKYREKKDEGVKEGNA
ncbi:MAG: Lon protease family protein [Omnitrophica WOR_2 bacterium]